MATFPGAKVHRTNRRRLGRGQFPTGNTVTVIVTDTGSVATLTFSQPVVVTGTIPITVSGGLTLVSQTQTSPTVVTQTWSGALTTKTYSIASAPANVMSYQGGQVEGTSGTFS